MADQATLAAAPEAAPAKKGKKKLLLVLVVLLVGAAAAYFLVLKPGGSAEAATPPPPEKGGVVTLEPIYINLAQGHFLKLGLALQATKSANVKEVDGSEALDAAIEVFSGQDMDKLTDPDVRSAFKGDLVEKVVGAYTDEVMDVYLTEFVMQ